MIDYKKQIQDRIEVLKIYKGDITVEKGFRIGFVQGAELIVNDEIRFLQSLVEKISVEVHLNDEGI